MKDRTATLWTFDEVALALRRMINVRSDPEFKRTQNMVAAEFNRGARRDYRNNIDGDLIRHKLWEVFAGVRSYPGDYSKVYVVRPVLGLSWFESWAVRQAVGPTGRKNGVQPETVAEILNRDPETIRLAFTKYGPAKGRRTLGDILKDDENEEKTD